ncbi:hypothetical protein AC1031_016671 [Aphanomyces cochlioides]|nr:hypothetical protein AC1031_016671 [Aphanomyces cochlioides]
MDDAGVEKKAKLEQKAQIQEAMETVGSQLCQEAEERVVKRRKTSTQRKPVPTEDETVASVLEFEKKKHEDDHTYRMQRLELERKSSGFEANKTLLGLTVAVAAAAESRIHPIKIALMEQTVRTARTDIWLLAKASLNQSLVQDA